MEILIPACAMRDWSKCLIGLRADRKRHDLSVDHERRCLVLSSYDSKDRTGQSFSSSGIEGYSAFFGGPDLALVRPAITNLPPSLKYD